MLVKLILLLTGMLVGYLSAQAFCKFRQKQKCEGTLRMIFDEDTDPYLFLELSVDPTLLAGKDDITLRITTEQASQK